jgi:hypothetical protein
MGLLPIRCIFRKLRNVQGKPFLLNLGRILGRFPGQEVSSLDGIGKSGVASWFDGEEGQRETVVISFTYEEEEYPLLIEIDGLSYTFTPSPLEGKELVWNLKLEEISSRAMIESAVLFPDALRLRLTGIDKEHWDILTVMTDAEGAARFGPTGHSYQEDAEEMTLVYEFGEGFQRKDWSFW